ncbi:AIPR family protein [Paenibacillus sp. Y412MC10]|uniref:AIPR family protein n=1 Tax=Geobacillus sp. (strain Y412MC10) TaxID=481743 RepID=UPI00119EE1F0|nr:AIPR family protein [Paenibacillus sp. Y412MC10]
MANINDFKIIKLKSRRMFNYLGLDNAQIEEVEKERLGFYHLILENITGIIDSEVKTYTIIDTQYNRIVSKTDVDDLGIDAVNIAENDNGEIDIQLFNFKYRNSFNPDKTKTEGDISRSTKFLEYIIHNEILDNVSNNIVVDQINNIIHHLNSNKVCNLYMYMVSNEALGFAPSSNDFIKILEKNYGMQLINISLDDIVSFYNTKKDSHKSSFMISPTEFLSFQSDEKSTQKSYILKLSLLDVIRISSNNQDLANNYAIEDDDQIVDSKIDLSLLYDNVRGFLGDTKYNKNIIETLKKKHQFFFMFNNGITITAEKIECNSKNSGMKYLFVIENFQIVNGGQTIRSIYNFLHSNHDLDKITKLREAYVLVRLFKTNKDDSLKNSIAEYTNSQNAISEVDLKSIDNLQIQLEKYLAEYNILYVRKAGDIGDINVDYHSRISMEKLAQVLYSSIGYPDRASNQKRRLFLDYYDEIFKTENFSLENCKRLHDKYVEVENHYSQLDNRHSDQKIFYIIYICSFTNLTISNAIMELETLLNAYESSLPDSRKLIQKGFKNFINSHLEIYLP